MGRRSTGPGRGVAAAVILSLGVLVALSAVGAQPAGRVPRVGMIVERANEPFLAAFRQGLQEVGYTDGKIAVEYRRVGDSLDRVPGLTADLVRLGVDILVVPGTVAARRAKSVTTTVPIVFVTAGDPVASGLVASLARPGGNATGLSVLIPDLTGKQIELLKAAVPKLARVTVLSNPDNPGVVKGSMYSAREAGRALGVEVDGVEARRREDLAGVLSPLTPRRAGALVVIPDPVFGAELAEIVKLTAANRLPAVYNRQEFARAGGLLSYGPSFADSYRRAAVYIDKILKGAKPEALPVEQPTKFELVINLKAAKALGIAVPSTLVSRADEVIR